MMTASSVFVNSNYISNEKNIWIAKDFSKCAFMGYVGSDWVKPGGNCADTRNIVFLAKVFEKVFIKITVNTLYMRLKYH